MSCPTDFAFVMPLILKYCSQPAMPLEPVSEVEEVLPPFLCVLVVVGDVERTRLKAEVVGEKVGERLLFDLGKCGERPPTGDDFLALSGSTVGGEQFAHP